MSSWRKASKLNQKTHRERHQPEARASLGLLEKKKDYKLRADDQHKKDSTLKVLRKRALNKNPDEFYHHMINSKINSGEHHEKVKTEEHTPGQIQLMQTQDIKYISMKRTIEAKKINRLQSQLHMVDIANKIENKHTFFVDSDEELANFDIAAKLNTHPSLLGRRTNRPKLSDLKKIAQNVDEEVINKLNAEKVKSYQELQKRVEREKELSVVQQKMELKRALQQKRVLKPKRLQGGTKDTAPIYKFQFERKR